MRSDELDTEQAMPLRNGSRSVQSMVREDLEVREMVGRERYGTSLQINNGRDALRDAYEEALDQACYLRQAIEERPREDVDAAVAAVRAELEPQIRRLEDLVAEMRRQMRPLQRQSEAWGTLLRLCQKADQEHWEANSVDGFAQVVGYARVPTDTIRAVLDQTPKPDPGLLAEVERLRAALHKAEYQLCPRCGVELGTEVAAERAEAEAGGDRG